MRRKLREGADVVKMCQKYDRSTPSYNKCIAQHSQNAEMKKHHTEQMQKKNSKVAAKHQIKNVEGEVKAKHKCEIVKRACVNKGDDPKTCEMKVQKAKRHKMCERVRFF